MIIFRHPVALAALSACFLSCSGPQANTPTIRKLDAARYSGVWHEIARLPNPFEKGLTAAKAIYQARPDGTLGVRNEGLKEDGTRTSITGTARQPEQDDPGKLRVRFDPFPANLFEGDYWILETNAAYTRAVVGSPDKKFLWLLSKDPADGRKDFQAQIQGARELGYATGELYFNPKRIAD
ncbi:MAG: lipocalin family protein [Verrucomicrobiota bacterium]